MDKENTMQEHSNEKSMEEQIDKETVKMTKDQTINSSQNETNPNIEEMGDEIIPKEQEEVVDEKVINVSTCDETVEEKQVKPTKSLFKNNKSKEIAAKDQKIEELSDRLVRNMAEFDNFRKRSEKEKSQMYDMGVKNITEKILPIIDNFERGLGTITEKEKDGAFAQGIEMIYKQLMNSLEEIGIKPIEAVGNEFNPSLHNAVMHGEDESMGTNVISEEFQKGYLYREIVVRHSMVKVVN